MRVRIRFGVTETTREFLYNLGDEIPSLGISKEIIVACDPSKTNFAMAIGGVYGLPEIYIEFSGNDKKYYSEPMDTTLYCLELENFINDILEGCNVLSYRAEAPVMYKKKKDGTWGKGGLGHYTSQMALTEIRATNKKLALIHTKKPEQDINVSTWKSATLPKEYRGRDEKGSLRYLSTLNPVYATCTDDITDVTCMYFYMQSELQRSIRIKCNGVENQKVSIKLSIIDQAKLPFDVKHFVFNEDYSCYENAVYYTNRTNKSGACKLPKGAVSLDDLYTFANDLNFDSNTYLLVEVIEGGN